MRITTTIQLIAITDVMTTSSISAVIPAAPATAVSGITLIVDAPGTLLEGVVNCELVSKRCSPISELLTVEVTSKLVSSVV